jgi:glycosyltransferase involved in cell wall biosynthesis
MAKPTVTAIVTSYNRAALVSRAIESVLNQTVPPQEVIVIDDGSTDGSQDVIARFGNAIRFLPQPHCGLPAILVNLGFREAKGDWIGRVDDDDWWEPNKLELQLAAVEGKSPPPALCYTDAYLVDENGERLAESFIAANRATPAEGDVFAALFLNNFIPGTSVLLHRESVLAVGGLCEAPEIRAVEDYDLWLRLAARHPFVFVPQPTLSIRRWSKGMSATSVTSGWERELAAIRKTLADETLPLEKLGSSRQARLRQLHRALAKQYWRDGAFARAARHGLHWLTS